ISVSVVHAEFVTLNPSQTGQVTQFANNIAGNDKGLFAGLAGTNMNGTTAGVPRGRFGVCLCHQFSPRCPIPAVSPQLCLLNASGTKGPQSVSISLHDVSTAWVGPAPSWPGPAFSSVASDSQDVTKQQLNTWLTWGSNSAMIQDVQNWLDNPSGNYGWLVQGG